MTISDATLRAVVDLIEVPITLLDLDGRIRHVNPANARLLGRTSEELRGEPISTVLPAAIRDQTDALLASLLEHGKVVRIFWNERPGMAALPVEVSATLVRTPDGAPRLILATVRDLSPELEQLSALNASTLGLLAAPGEDLLVTTVQVARELLRARYAALGVFDAGRLVRFIPDGLSESQIAAIGRWPEGRGLLGAMIAEQETIRVADLGSDPARGSGHPGHQASHDRPQRHHSYLPEHPALL